MLRPVNEPLPPPPLIDVMRPFQVDEEDLEEIKKAKKSKKEEEKVDKIRNRVKRLG